MLLKKKATEGERERVEKILRAHLKRGTEPNRTEIAIWRERNRTVRRQGKEERDQTRKIDNMHRS